MKKRETFETQIARRATVAVNKQGLHGENEISRQRRAWFRYGFICGLRAEHRRMLKEKRRPVARVPTSGPSNNP